MAFGGGLEQVIARPPGLSALMWQTSPTRVSCMTSAKGQRGNAQRFPERAKSRLSVDSLGLVGARVRFATRARPFRARIWLIATKLARQNAACQPETVAMSTSRLSSSH